MSRTKKMIVRLLTASLASGAFSVLADGALAQQRHVAEHDRPAFPVISLGRNMSAGQAAIDQLGARLGEVAAWYGKTELDLRKELLADRRLRVDKSGRLLAVEEMTAPVQTAAVSPAQSAIQQGALVGLDQTFRLHSNPGAARTIYLDFNGATITGTAWNSNGNSLNAQPFDLDGNPGSFSAAELERIQFIWQRVAEDYAPFDVDVTTEQPAQDAITRSSTTDGVFGTTVVITKTTGVYSCTCGGIAYVGVFNYAGGSYAPDYYKPALVFYDMLGRGDEKAVAEAISHEVGHNVGLHHDGTGTESYYEGQGSDPATGWAPIMGVGYYKPLVQFSRGEYSGASNTQDDFAVAQSFGLPLRRDDHASAADTASLLQPTVSGTTASVSVDGILSSASDRDVFAIASGAGVITASVMPASRSANADLVISLLNGSGQLLAQANPANELGASLSFTLPAQGTYYLEVTGAGQGDAATTGYSSYGSVGNFRLLASFATPVGGAPTAVLTASTTGGAGPLSVTLNGAASTDDGSVAFWYWDFGDGTSDRTGSLSSVSHVYRAAGTYYARLTVVDNSGLSASATQRIVVASATAATGVRISPLKFRTTLNGISATAMVTVTGANGKVVPGARVRVSWKGVVSQTLLRQTGTNGVASFVSPASKSRGCYVLSVTSVTAPGHTFPTAALPTVKLCR